MPRRGARQLAGAPSARRKRRSSHCECALSACLRARLRAFALALLPFLSSLTMNCSECFRRWESDGRRQMVLAAANNSAFVINKNQVPDSRRGADLICVFQVRPSTHSKTNQAAPNRLGATCFGMSAENLVVSEQQDYRTKTNGHTLPHCLAHSTTKIYRKLFFPDSFWPLIIHMIFTAPKADKFAL